MDYDVKIRRQNRRSLMMRAVPGGIEVFIPHWLDETNPQVKRFIKQGLTKLSDTVQPPPAEQTSEAQILAMVADWAAVIGVEPGRVQFRTMYRKWGSCSSRGNITLNKALCWMPPHLAEYVVLHELVHLIVFNHGKRFQAMMSDHMPDWRERQAAINAQFSTFGEC